MDNERYWSGDRISVTAGGKRLQGYHRLEIEADHSYTVDLWKDGALKRGRKGYRLKENTDPGIDLAITTDGDLSDERYRISPGRSSDASHYADMAEMDDEVLGAAEDAVQQYMDELDDDGSQEIGDFFEAVRDGLL